MHTVVLLSSYRRDHIPSLLQTFQHLPTPSKALQGQVTASSPTSSHATHLIAQYTLCLFSFTKPSEVAPTRGSALPAMPIPQVTA